MFQLCATPDRDCWLGHKDSGANNIWLPVDTNPAFSTSFVPLTDPSTFQPLQGDTEAPWAAFEPDDGIVPWVSEDCAHFASGSGNATIMDGACDALQPSVCQTLARCPAGWFRSGTMCQACPLGRYSSQPTTAGAEVCQPCLAGRYGGAVGLTDAQCSGPCSEGHYCSGANTSPTESPCPPGRYGSSEGLATSACSGRCDAGFYCVGGEVSREGVDALHPEGKKCAAGRYGNSGEGSSSCTGPCQAGYFCPAGSWKRNMYHCSRDATDPSQPFMCLSNDPVPVLVECPHQQICPLGSAGPQPVPRYYHSYSDLCCAGPCQEGEYCVNGQDLKCAAGYWGESNNEHEDPTCAGPCTAGYQCPLGSESPTAFPCGWDVANDMPRAYPRNYYCPEGTSESMVVPADHYSTGGSIETRTGIEKCPADYACILGWHEMKVEYYEGCTRYVDGTEGRRTFSGAASADENTLDAVADITVAIRPPGLNVTWAVAASCSRLSSQYSGPEPLDTSSQFSVTVGPATSTTVYGEWRTATVSAAVPLNYEECEVHAVKLVATVLEPSEPLPEHQVQVFACDLAVQVRDTNDPPYFEGEDGEDFYVRVTPEGVNINSPVGEPVTASDEDVGQEHTYIITAGNSEGMFGVTRCGGQLFTLNDRLDFEGTAEYNLTLTVADSAEKGPSLQASTTVRVLLTNVNEQPFFNVSSGTHGWSVAENDDDGRRVQPLPVLVVDPDGDNLTVSITLKDGDVENPALQLEGGVGPWLETAFPLDFESIQKYRLTVFAQDSEFTIELDDAVDVLDRNDPPTFAQAYSFVIPEDTPFNFSSPLIEASDPDGGAVIAMSIVEGNEDGAFRLARVTDTAFQLQVTSGLDFESTFFRYQTQQVGQVLTRFRQVRIMANDSVAVAFTVANITVEDANEPPSTAPFFNVNVSESTPVGAFFGPAPNVSDPEFAFSTYTWSVSPSGLGPLPFTVDPRTGRLRLTGALDFEGGGSNHFHAILHVADSGTPPLSTQANLSVHVENANEPPQVSSASLALIENAAPATQVGLLAGFDVDAGDTAHLRWAPCNDSHPLATPSGWELFNLTASGNISVAGGANTTNPWASDLDFEDRAVYELCVICTDRGIDGPPLSTATTVVVTLLDVNEPPRFSSGVQVMTIGDGTPAGVSLGMIQIEDQDFADVHTFSFLSGNLSLFETTADGNVTTSQSVRIVTSAEHEVYAVRAVDSGGFVANTTLNITIADSNDRPEFSGFPRLVSVFEHSTSTVPLLQVTATDADPDDTLQFSITQIVPSLASSAIQIDTSSGEVSIADSAALDFEGYGQGNSVWKVWVRVNDKNDADPGHVSLSNDVLVEIDVKDVPESPSIVPAAFSVQENHVGPIGTLTATDADFDEVFVWVLQNVSATASFDSNAFALNATTGELSVIPGKVVDFEALTSSNPVVTLTVRVTDKYGESAVRDVPVSVGNENEAPSIESAVGRVVEEVVAARVTESEGSSPLTLVVSDPDSMALPMGQVGLFIREVWPFESAIPFSIVSEGGTFGVTTQRALDFENVGQWTLDVCVEDGGSPPLLACALLNVSVVNDLSDVRLTSVQGWSGNTSVSTVQVDDFVRISGDNLGFTNRRLALGGEQPLLTASVSFDLQGEGSLVAEVGIPCEAIVANTVVQCPVPDGLGTGVWSLQVVFSATEIASSTSAEPIRVPYSAPLLTSVDRVDGESMDLLPTAGGVQVRLRGVNFGPLSATLGANPVSYGRSGGSVREGQLCVREADGGVSALLCMTAPAVGIELEWQVALGGQQSNQLRVGKHKRPSVDTVRLFRDATPIAFLSSGGSEFIQVQGGDLGNAGVQLVYRLATDSSANGALARYKGTSCSISLPHNTAVCQSMPGSGRNHRLQVIVGSDEDGWQTSDPSTVTVSYGAPSIQVGGISGPGAIRADTQGGQVIIVAGANFGARTPLLPGAPAACGGTPHPPSSVHLLEDPSLLPFNVTSEVPQLVYGPASDPNRYKSSSCVVSNVQSTRLSCCSAVGTGKGFVYRVSVDGQESPLHASQNLSTGYHPPVLQSFDPRDAQGRRTEGGGVISVLGSFFGPSMEFVEQVAYGKAPLAENLEFSAENCTMVRPHFELECLTAEGAGKGLSWTVKVNGQRSETPTTGHEHPQISHFSGQAMPVGSARGGQWLIVHGSDFGPPTGTVEFGGQDFVDWVRYGPTGAEYTASCAVLSHFSMNCTTVPGTGPNLLWTVSVADLVSSPSLTPWSYASARILDLHWQGQLSTAGNVNFFVRGTDFGILDANTLLRVRFRPEVGNVTVRLVEIARPLPANASQDELQVRVPFGWGSSCVVTVESVTVFNGIQRGGVLVSQPLSFSYAPPAVSGTSVISGTRQEITIVGSSFGAVRIADNITFPLGVLVVHDASSNETHSSDDGSGAVQLLSWSHSRIVASITASRGHVIVKTFMTFASDGGPDYFASPASPFESSTPQATTGWIAGLRDDPTQYRLPTLGGMQLNIRATNVDGCDESSLEVYIGEAEELALGDRSDCGLVPCLVSRGRRECTITKVEHTGEVAPGTTDQLSKVSCMTPPGQGTVGGLPISEVENELQVSPRSVCAGCAGQRLILNCAGKFSVNEHMPVLSYARPTITTVTVLPGSHDAELGESAVFGWTLDVGTRGGRVGVTGHNFGQLKHWEFDGLRPGMLDDSTLGPPLSQLPHWMNHSVFELSIPPLVHGSPTMAAFPIRLVVGPDPNLALDVPLVSATAVEDYAFSLKAYQQLFGYPATSPEAIHIRVRPPVVAAQEVSFGTAGGEVLRLEGDNFGEGSKPQHLPEVLIGGKKCVLQETYGSQSAARAELVASNPDSPHEVITCFVPPGVGRSKEVLLRVGGHMLSNQPGGGLEHVKVHYRPPEVQAVHPERGPTQGGTVITMSGLNFGASAEDAMILFASQTYPVGTPDDITAVDPESEADLVGDLISYNHTHVVFKAPAGQGEIKQVQLTVAGQVSVEIERSATAVWPPQPHAAFEYGDPRITFIRKNGTCFTEGCEVTLEGENFGRAVVVNGSVLQPLTIDVLPDKLRCRLVALEHTIARCRIGEGIGKHRNIHFQLGYKSADFPWFTYAPPLLRDVVPNVVNALGGRTLRFDGVNFGPVKPTWSPAVNVTLNNATCEGAAVFNSHNEIRCVQPAGVVGPAIVQMTIAGNEMDQDPAEIEGLLQYTCERGWYGQVSEVCVPCPFGAVCDFSGRYNCTAYRGTVCTAYPEPWSDATFWRDDKPADSVLCDPLRRVRPPPFNGTCPVFLRCEPENACLGNNTCATGYTGFRCSSCAERFYRFDGECKRCPDRDWLLPLLFAVGLIVVGGFGWWLNKKNINLALMSISVDYMQVLALFARSKIEWPQLLKDLFSYMSFFNFNLDITAPECAMPELGYGTKWTAIMILPMAIFFLFWLMYICTLAYKRFVRRLSPKARTAHRAPIVGACLTLSYFMYLYVSRTVLDVFNCSPTDPPDDWPPGYMQADFIPCFKPGGLHERLFPPAIVLFFVYVLAYPISIFLWLRRNKGVVKVDQLLRAYGYGESERTSDAKHYGFRRMFHKIYYHFKPGKWYWITVIITRKFFIAITSLLFRSTPAYQMAMIVMVLFFGYSAHIHAEPFMSRPEHRAIVLAHERQVAEHNTQHQLIDAELQPLVAKARRAERAEFRKVGFRAEEKRAAAKETSQLQTNYNTVESVLLVSAILVALSGIMFNSNKMTNMESSPAKDALTMLVLLIIAASVAYFVIVFTVEIVETIGDDPVCCCHCLRPRIRKWVLCAACGPCQVGYAALKWAHSRYLMSQRRVATVDELVEATRAKGKEADTDSRLNPLAAMALARNAEKGGAGQAIGKADALLKQPSPPSQSDWFLLQLAFKELERLVQQELPSSIRTAKRSGSRQRLNHFKAAMQQGNLIRPGKKARRQFSQKLSDQPQSPAAGALRGRDSSAFSSRQSSGAKRVSSLNF